MPYLVRWSANALAELARVHAFLAQSDSQAALKALDAIEAGTDVLEQFPHAGRPTDDLEPEHRELLIPFGASGYAVVYEVEEASVLILSLKHQREAGYPAPR